MRLAHQFQDQTVKELLDAFWLMIRVTDGRGKRRPKPAATVLADRYTTGY